MFNTHHLPRQIQNCSINAFLVVSPPEKVRLFYLIGAIRETLSTPCFIAEEKSGTTLYVKSFTKDNEQKNIMSVVIKRDGLNISISTHEERESQILSKIKKAGVLMETASDDGTVHDNRVADTTRVVSLIITDEAPKVKSSCINSRNRKVVLFYWSKDGNGNKAKDSLVYLFPVNENEWFQIAVRPETEVNGIVAPFIRSVGYKPNSTIENMMNQLTEIK